MYDVLVIGAGVVGALTARELTKYNLSVCIAEKENDVAMGATGANSAIVHAGFDAKPGTLKARLNVRGAELMEKTSRELGVRYEKNGSVVIGFNEDDRKTIESLYEQGTLNGVRDLEILDTDALHRLEPNISDDAVCALYAPTGAIVCPYELCIAAVGNAMDNGADLKLNYQVASITKLHDGFEVRAKNGSGEPILAKYIINAAGVYADDIAKMVGDDSFSIHPRRGEYILLDKGCGNLVQRTIFRTPTSMGKGILVSHTVDGNLLLGPTSVDMSSDEKNNTETTMDGMEKIMQEASQNLKNIPFGKTVTSFCGLRAVGSTGDFIIRSSTSGMVHVAGIESPGLSSSPAIAQYVVSILQSMGVQAEPNKNFHPTRASAHAFRDAGIEQKNQVISQNPAFGKIICRCEQVTEGEILNAIHQNPGARDIDGVKRRTRAGMGRCQGGFCMSYVMELLSRELGVPYECITKKGGNSHPVVGRTKQKAVFTKTDDIHKHGEEK